MPGVVIIGGGFCGAACALELRRLAPAVPISVVEPRAELGRGVAYSSTDPAHRVNVPAALMTMYPGQPLHFVDWLERSGALAADPGMPARLGLYPRRSVFGDYAAWCVAQAEGIAHRRDRAVALARAGSGWRVTLAGGEVLHAGLVVLATSHPPPSLPAPLSPLAGDPRLVADPWASDALDGIGPEERVLIIGTGLTMADHVAGLLARGHRGPIAAVSRHGLLSRGHAATDQPAFEAFPPPPSTARGLLRMARAAIAGGAAWQSVVRGLTIHGQRCWDALPDVERRRLLRHLRAWWDVHRYRLAPQVEAIVQDAIGRGQLRVMAARLLGVETAPLAVRLRPRGGSTETRIAADRVLLATGPAHGSAVAGDALLAAAAAAGLLRADPLGLGIAVDARSRVLDGAGVAQRDLLVAGPLARGTFGELVGLPQVTEHAAMVAAEAAAMTTPCQERLS